tara:strand:- start:1573 stop:4212 length:2640 start_codon:yes stop_codon:yes gene_type:complete
MIDEYFKKGFFLSVRYIYTIFIFYLVTYSFAESYDPSRFEREILVPRSRDALQLEVLKNGDIIFVEFTGSIKRWYAKHNNLVTLGKVKTYAKGEVGLLGFAVSRNFLDNGHLFALYCPEAKNDTMRVSRFTVKSDVMNLASEDILLEWAYDNEHIYHMGGAVFMDRKSHLYIGNGDNCHWMPGLPVDFRPNRKNWDALRSAGNSKDLRGKILRIKPKEEGGYTIPSGNLFSDPKLGRPEIYAMGVRNPFRMTVDDVTDTLYFGDVGPNVFPELKIKPFGYDEINAAPKAGNFGWPLFIGPNEPYPVYDFVRNKPVRTYKPQSPLNTSPNNTGLKKLPPAKPALIWYGNNQSQHFPTLGSGGRSIMAGPVYRWNPDNNSKIHLPKKFDGNLFIYEWMRNWIQTVDLNTIEPVVRPFLPDWNLRRPIDMKLGVDGALYMIEYGDRWWENKDSRISRIIYRRGNRPPIASIKVDINTGTPPLKVTFDAKGSNDPDGDLLNYFWDNGKTGPLQEITFKNTGTYEISLSVKDPSGASDSDTKTIYVGNNRPLVKFKSPAQGSFFDWGMKIDYEIEVQDAETEEIDPTLVSMQTEFRNRRYLTDEHRETTNPGLKLMRKSTCFACHISDAISAGPSYQMVANKYENNTKAPELLANKVINGGSGVWGEYPMPPHPQHSLSQARLMIGWILSLNKSAANISLRGAKGTFTAPTRPKATAFLPEGFEIRVNEGVLFLTAGYTDAGGTDTPPLRGESSIILHSRRKKAALYDVNHGMQYVEHADGEKGIIGHFENGDFIIFKELNLKKIRNITVRAGGLTEGEGYFEIRQGSRTGKLLSSIKVRPVSSGQFNEISGKLQDTNAIVDVCIVARTTEDDILGLNWVEFQK